MSSLLQRAALVVLLFAVAGCSAVSDTTDTVTGWFKSSDNTLAAGNKQAASNAAAASLKYGATLRV
ncbi:MAG: hypothetical protein PHF75_09500, partial [Gallionella sp.]|nr:hypothetical protein [Gallionella sp.]